MANTIPCAYCSKPITRQEERVLTLHHEASRPGGMGSSESFTVCQACFDATDAEDGTEDDADDAPVASEDCPACNGPGTQLGTLGRLDWFRCRNCGTDFHA